MKVLQQLNKDWRTWDCLHTASLEVLLGRKVENISGIINKKNHNQREILKVRVNHGPCACVCVHMRMCVSEGNREFI